METQWPTEQEEVHKCRDHLFGSLLDIHAGLLAHGSEDGDVAVLALLIEHLLDSLTNLTLGELDVVLGVTGLVHEGEETVVGDIEELVFTTGDVGNVHVVGGGRKIFQLLAGEDIEGNDVNLGVTVLASLGGRHINDLAGTTLDDNVTVLSQSGALHGVGRRRTSVGGLEGLMLVSHGESV